jgi:hypothetical protein
MKARFAALGAIGASAGMAVAIIAGSSAMAAGHGSGNRKPAPVPAASATCATFAGLNVTSTSVSYSAVALKAGQTITAHVSPAASGDSIFLSEAVGLSMGFYEGPATGFSFRAPGDAVYNLAWSLKSPTGATVPTTLSWSFQCS